MDTYMQALLLAIRQHEGFRGLPYLDKVGKWTLGYGRNLDAKGLHNGEWQAIITTPITILQGEILLKNDINPVISWLSQYSWWAALTDNRKIALADMAFNLGEAGFKDFVHMISAVARGDYVEAANQMKQSPWYAQVGSRAQADILLMLHG